MADREDTSRDDGLPWGYLDEDGVFREPPKPVLLRAGYGPPPFDIEMSDGRVRHFIHKPGRIA